MDVDGDDMMAIEGVMKHIFASIISTLGIPSVVLREVREALAVSYHWW